MTASEHIIALKGVSKRYKNTLALDHVDLSLGRGEIVGLFGPNGAGKTTLLRAILGLANVEGQLEVAGFDPRKEGAKLMERVSFIADTAILPRWIKVRACLEFVAAVHPRFDKDLALRYLQQTKISLDSKVSHLSKGMITQLHLALVMAIDANLLVLDEPTLGLDIVFRKNFYRDLLDNYFEQDKTIVITTHQIEEIEDLVTRIVFLNEGSVILNCAVDELAQRFCEVRAERGTEAELLALKPLYQQSGLEGQTFWFENADQENLSKFGQVRQAKLADLFVAKVMDAEQHGEVKQ